MDISAHTLSQWRFDNSYARLPEILFRPQYPVAVRAPSMVLFNERLAAALGLHVATEDAADLFSGNLVPDGAEPIAQAYAGHQFGGFAMLGDGRAVLLGEHITPDGWRVDIALKGSGKTPFSRRGDGRAALAPMLREYIISEAMHGLGIPTTRSLAVVTTGEAVMRESLLSGAVLTRVATSHIRVGTFEYVAALGDVSLLKILADYTIARHYPEIERNDTSYLDFLDAAMERQAALIARWQMVGFIHGVMNTDNMAISGETIDYGPCAFMNSYDPATVFSSIDQQGRYAYVNQPRIGQWNIARFAEALLPLFHTDKEQAFAIAEESISRFPAKYHAHWLAGMRAKLGLYDEEADDEALISDLLAWMQASGADYTNSFRALSPEHLGAGHDDVFAQWHGRWRLRLVRQDVTKEKVLRHMQRHNPAIIPRNHRVEEALEAACEREDLQPILQLLAALQQPYSEQEAYAHYREPPADHDVHYQTFCGT